MAPASESRCRTMRGGCQRREIHAVPAATKPTPIMSQPIPLPSTAKNSVAVQKQHQSAQTIRKAIWLRRPSPSQIVAMAETAARNAANPPNSRPARIATRLPGRPTQVWIRISCPEGRQIREDITIGGLNVEALPEGSSTPVSLPCCLPRANQPPPKKPSFLFDIAKSHVHPRVKLL